MMSHHHRIILLVVMATIVAHRAASDHCQPIKQMKGLNYLNCSETGMFHLPEYLDEKAEVLDFRQNNFMELPIILESPLCKGPKDCDVVNNTKNYCRFDISFSRNEIFKFQDKVLRDLKCLRTLDLSYNDIRSSILHQSTFMKGADNLENLILRGNPLGNLPDNVIDTTFQRHLRYIDLSHCQLEEIGENSVDDHIHLSTLNLSNNKLTAFKNQTFKNLRNLRVLDLSHNQLKSFGPLMFGDLVNLDSLILADNKIESFAKNAFFKDSKLKTLDLTQNNLEAIPYLALQELPEMSHLILSNNPLESVSNPDSSITLPSVRTLELEEMLSMNTMGKLALGSFPNLARLYIRRNRNLAFIHPDFLAEDTPQLREIHLDYNGLTSLSEDALPMVELTTLSLKGNPWYCDYRLRWMIRAKVVLPGHVICDGPIQLKGRDIKTLQPVHLQKPFTLSYVIAVILVAISTPAIGISAYVMWKRRDHIRCCKRVQGRYVSVYTRDVDSENEDRVDIQVKINRRRLKAVSNGSAEDTQPFIMIESLPATEDIVPGKEEEEEEVEMEDV